MQAATLIALCDNIVFLQHKVAIETYLFMPTRWTPEQLSIGTKQQIVTLTVM